MKAISAIMAFLTVVNGVLAFGTAVSLHLPPYESLMARCMDSISEKMEEIAVQ